MMVTYLHRCVINAGSTRSCRTRTGVMHASLAYGSSTLSTCRAVRVM